MEERKSDIKAYVLFVRSECLQIDNAACIEGERSLIKT